MSCSCNNSCDPEHEPLPSTVDNFVTQFFGEVTKTCVDGSIVWTLPCNLDEGIPGYPRQEGEGLACYFSRVLEDISMGGGGGGPVDALLRPNNLSDLTNVPTARSNLGLGSMATQNATNVAITGGSIANAQIINPVITGLTLNSANLVAPTITSALISSSAINGGTITSPTITNAILITPTVTGGTLTGTAVKALPAPVLADDAATKAYADAAAAGLSILSPVRVATTGSNITLSGGAPSTLDTIPLAPGDRILVKDQSTPSQNGVYEVQTLGTGSNGTWVRTADADTTGELITGTYVFVDAGATNSSTSFVLTTTGTITIGVTPITWTQYFSVGSISFSSITGSVVASQIASVNAGSIIGSITASQIGSINAGSITGLITSSQIGSVNAGTITGLISSSQIGSINAGAIIGLISSSQIGSVNASAIIGGISASQINDVNATAIVGSITAGQISSVTAGSITGVIVGAQLVDQILNTQRLIASDISVVRRVASLPALPNANYPVGALALNTTNQTLYQNVSNTWTVVTSSSSVTGTLTANDIASVNAGAIVGLIIASQIGSVNATSITGSISSSQIGSVSATSITGSITSSQIGSVSGSTITGSISAGLITGGISASQISSVNATSISGTISAGQIGSVNATTITIGTLVDGQISSVSAGKLTSGTIVAQQIVLSNSASSIIRSDNYSAGSAGWRILGNGNAEFNNVAVRAGVGDGALNATSSGTTFGNTSNRYFAFEAFATGTTQLVAKAGGSPIFSVGAYDIGAGQSAASMSLSSTAGGGSLQLAAGSVSFSSGGLFENVTFRANATSVDAKDCNVRVTTGGSPVIVLNRDVGGQPEIWINGQKVVKQRYTGSVTNTSEIIACLQYHGLCN